MYFLNIILAPLVLGSLFSLSLSIIVQTAAAKTKEVPEVLEDLGHQRTLEKRSLN